MSQWVPVREAAVALGVSEATLKRRLKSGALPGRQERFAKGTRWLVEVEDQPSHDASIGDHPEVAHLEATVAQLQADRERLWAEVEARRREVAELHVLLQQAQQQTLGLLLPPQRDPSAIADAVAGGTPRAPWWAFWRRGTTEPSPA